ncbi:MAG: hypothetical protein GY856_09415 [bacterium]|nr:hypothetical protein [bacterium]
MMRRLHRSHVVTRYRPHLPSCMIAGLLGAFLLAAASASWGQESFPDQGFIYGEVETRSGSTYEGRMRWADEEAFWGDLFNSTKEERPYLDDVPRDERRRREPVKIFGVSIGLHLDTDVFEGRRFVARFGDIRKIRVRRGNEAVVTMKSGSEYEVDGGSNDLGGTIFIWDVDAGEVELRWNRIDTIEFLPTPVDVEVSDHRLHGTVKTDVGEFRGFIQWDQEECLASDELDGDHRDRRMSIEMGRIRSIERYSRSRSRVILRDGEELVLDGTNDVNSDNRGIFVEDPRYGRLLISWDAFEAVEFSEPGTSGPSYQEFAPGKPLHGTVTDRGGKSYRGRIVYDVDEQESWEVLDGEWRDVEYRIPFELVAAVIPEGRDASRVLLKGGEELLLEDSADVGGDHAGVLIFGEERAEPSYLPWEEVRRIDFDG